MIRLLEKNINDHDEFVKKHKYTDMFQLSSWAKVKEMNGWTWDVVSVGDDDGIKGSALLLYKKIPMFNLNLCYSPRGFMVDWDDKETADFLISEVVKNAKKHNSILIKLDPACKETVTDAKDVLENRGFVHSGFLDGLQTLAQPRHHVITDISMDEKALMKSFQSRTRTDVRKSLKNGLVMEDMGADKVDVFYDLMQITSERDGFGTRSASYFKKILEEMKDNDDAKLFLVKVDPKQALENLNKDLKNKEKEISRAKKKNEDGSRDQQISQINNSITNTKNQIAEIEEMQKSNPNGQYLSGALYTQCGPIAYYLYGASSNELRDLMPNYFMQWQMMLYAKSNDCKIYDFGGVSGQEDQEDDEAPGLYEFKKRWGSEKESRIGEFDYVLKPIWNSLFNFALSAKKNLYHITKMFRN